MAVIILFIMGKCTAVFHLFCFLFITAGLPVALSGCAFTPVKRSKGIVYLPADTIRHKPAQKLNVFAPRNRKKAAPVLVHFYGGNWTSGKRSLYSFFGSRMARKHIVTVIPDYPKSPDAAYSEMATDAATAVRWVRDHIADYGGDPERIYVSGHSAGGHLAALIAVKPSFFQELNLKNPVKGVILIDAAGLDMYGYMKTGDYGPNDSYLSIFSGDPETWKAASPLYQLHRQMPPMLIYTGGRTYPSIAESNRKMVDSLQAYHAVYTARILKHKKHIPMITQFFNSYNPRYREIKAFMNGSHQ